MVAPICPECRKQQRTRKDVDNMCPRHYDGPLLCDRCRHRPPPTVALNNAEVKTLSSLYKRHASVNATNGMVHIPTSGRHHRVLELPAADTPSSEASERSLRRRSEIINQAIEAVSTKRGRSDEEKEQDVIAQLAHWKKKPRTARLLHLASCVRPVGRLTVMEY